MKKSYLIIILIFALTGTANAENGFYVGGGIGFTNFNGSDSLLTAYSENTIDDYSFSGKIFAGYKGP